MMLRALGAFLFVFCLLALVVQQDALARLFGGASIALFAIDLILAEYASGTQASRSRVRPIV